MNLFLLNKRILGYSNSEGKDSTRGLEIIRPIETLPILNVPRMEARPAHSKMSMIYEEDYSETMNQKPIPFHVHEKMQKTTNDHIQEFQNKERIKESQFMRNSSKPSSTEPQNLSPPQINRITAFKESLGDEANDTDHEIRTDKSDYDHSVSLRKNR